MFFQSFWTWLTARLTSYVSVHAAATAAAIEPVAVTVGVVYVMAWGYLHLRGKIEEPVVEAAVRLLTLVVVFGLGLRLWLYHALIVDTFFTAPAELAARLVGARDPVLIIDAIWDRGGSAAGTLWAKGSIFTGDAGFYIAAVAVYVLIGLLCIYAMFLIALSRIALAVLLALGPLFILMTLFESTRKFFDAWLRQLANYALVTVLTVLVAALMLDLVDTYATETAALGSALKTVDALNLALVAGLVSLVLRQVLPIAAGLSGGGALSSFGALGMTVHRGREALRETARATIEFVRPDELSTRRASWRTARQSPPGEST
jgi:type IV secretion system protein VirB6